MPYRFRSGEIVEREVNVTHPECDYPRVPPLRTAPTAPDPGLSDEKQNGHDNPVGNEAAALRE